MPKFYGYGRVSHIKQEVGESIDGQTERAKRYFAEKYEGAGYEWAGFFAEPKHVSARFVPFDKRKAGREVLCALEAGDVLYVDKVDRLWRNLHDFSDLYRWFENHKIGFVVGNFLGVTADMNTPMGRWLLGSAVLYAQLESDTTSDRIKANFAYQRANGFWSFSAAHAPLGTKVVPAVPAMKAASGKPKKMLAWDIPKRLLMAEIVQRYDIGHQTWNEISVAITQKTSGGHVPKFGSHREWSPRRCAYAYALEKEYALIQEVRYLDTRNLPTMTEACARVQAPFARGPRRPKSE